MVLNEKFEKHNTLNPKLWANNRLLPEVKEKIIEIIDQFLQTIEIDIKILDARIVGSQASFNYTKDSDLDIHLITNFELMDASEEILTLLYNALKTKFNKDYEIQIRGIDVELYVEDMKSAAISNGMYSIYEDRWIKFPKKLDNIPDIDISDEFNDWSENIRKAINEANPDQLEEMIDKLYIIRKDGLDTEGEYGPSNQLFKEIRNAGLLDNLKDAYRRGISKELTLEHYRLNEDSRSSLLAKSKQSKKGFERFKKRVKSRVANSVKQFNQIDMNKLFKDNILTVDIAVKGETDEYIVKISFGGFKGLIQDQIKRIGKFDLKAVTRALINGFNKDDVYIHCSCLHPNTLIKLLDGRTVTVEEMCRLYESGEDLYVYSTDKNGDFKPGHVEKVWVTKKTSEFIKVTLDNGESILTTPDHPYMLRTGNYCLAEHLQVGDSLMPLYTSETSNGYETIKLNTTGKYHSTYKLVANSLKEDEINAAKLRINPDDNMPYDIAIHHVDFIKSNNHPDNLKVMTAKEHWSYHNQLSFPNKPLEMQENIRRISRANAQKRNANPTSAMLEQRTAFQEAGRLRNYDEDRKQQQSEIAKKVFKEFYDNLTPQEAERLSVLRSENTKSAWETGKFDTEAFRIAAKQRGLELHTPEREVASRAGVIEYWDTISCEDKQKRDEICRKNLSVAHENRRGVPLSSQHKQRISESRLNRSEEQKAEAIKRSELTKIKNILLSIINNGETISEDTYKKYHTKGSPHYSKHFDTLTDAISYYQINHRIVSIEHIILPETPVYDIKVSEWENFAIAAGIVLHNCPDWTYRYAYYATKNNINSGDAENRASNITNPDDKLGSACKHVLLVLSNNSWCLKVASTIYNYVNYMEKHYQKLYADIIYPAIYGKKYEEPTQLDIFDNDNLETDKETIDKSNQYAVDKSRFQKGNTQGVRFAPKSKNPDQVELFDEESDIDDNIDNLA